MSSRIGSKQHTEERLQTRHMTILSSLTRIIASSFRIFSSFKTLGLVNLASRCILHMGTKATQHNHDCPRHSTQSTTAGY